VDLRVTDRAKADVSAALARNVREYIEICNVANALRAAGKLAGEPFAVVNDQYDVHAYEVPGASELMILICDPATPQIVAFARLMSGDFSRRAKTRMASEAASALGLINPQIDVL
jgi:hypothetical protein